MSKLVWALFLVVWCNQARCDDREALTRQLISASGMGQILRNTATNASALKEMLAPTMSADERAKLQHIVDENFGYSRLEMRVLAEVAQETTAEALDANARWWASSTGRAIARAEGTVHASLWGASAKSPNKPLAPGEVAMIQAVGAASQYGPFTLDLIAQSSSHGAKLLDAASLGTTCLTRATLALPEQQLRRQLETRVDAQLIAAYGTVPADLPAYRNYLDSDYSRSVLPKLRAAVLKVHEEAFKRSIEEVNRAMREYASRQVGTGARDLLKRVKSDIDARQNLERAARSLDLLRRASPPDVVLLRESARMAIIQSASTPKPRIKGRPLQNLDAGCLLAAQEWLEQAVALDRRQADTWVLYGYLAYLKGEFPRGLEMLERAKSLGTDNWWLTSNTADVLWAMAQGSGVVDPELTRRAADKYEEALRNHPPKTGLSHVLLNLAEINADLGDLDRADQLFKRYVDAASIDENAWQVYANFLFFGKRDLDRAIVAARKAGDFPGAQRFLAQLLLVKSAALRRASQPAEAAKMFAEARRAQRDVASLAPALAFLPSTLSGVYALHDQGALTDFSGSLGGTTLVYASRYATPSVIEDFLQWGASPHFFEPSTGTPLHAAAQARNAPVVKLLLARGADPLTPNPSGQTALQLVSHLYPRTPAVEEVAALLGAASAGKSAAAGTPLKPGYLYRIKREIPERGRHTMHAGDTWQFAQECHSNPDEIARGHACFQFRNAQGGQGLYDIAFDNRDLSAWKDWFEELGPAPK